MGKHDNHAVTNSRLRLLLNNLQRPINRTMLDRGCLDKRDRPNDIPLQNIAAQWGSSVHWPPAESM